LAKSGRVDLEAVYQAALTARRARVQFVEAVKMRAWRRELFQEAALVRRQLVLLVRRIRHSYVEAAAYSVSGYGRDQLPPVDLEESAVLAQCDALIEALETDRLMRAIPNPPLKPAISLG
jgi:hypothetical protein